MSNIITLTVNPAIDKSTSVAGIKPDSKLRCDPPVYEAGGGGVNISKVLKELGGSSHCMYLAGGPTGTHLKNLLDAQGIVQQVIPIEGWVRENLAVTDTLHNQQYRFGMPGPVVSQTEWEEVLERLDSNLGAGDFLAASGSLGPGMPVDFFARAAAIAGKHKAKYILDSSGEALLRGAQAGVFLLKPNLGELAMLGGVKMISFQDIHGVARKFLDENPCEMMVVSLGAQGAMLFQKESDKVTHITAPIVPLKSAIGAGDSMVAGMIFALSEGMSAVEMAKFGVACGSAATMTAGTRLCKKKDAEALYQWILTHSVDSQNIRLNA